jgi:hypothetical protein
MLDVELNCMISNVVTRQDKDGDTHIAMVLPSTNAMVKGVILADGDTRYDDDEITISDHYGNTLNLSDYEDIEALAGFLLLYVSKVKERNALLEESIPEDAKCGAMSDEEIAELEDC